MHCNAITIIPAKHPTCKRGRIAETAPQRGTKAKCHARAWYHCLALDLSLDLELDLNLDLLFDLDMDLNLDLDLLV